MTNSVTSRDDDPAATLASLPFLVTVVDRDLNVLSINGPVSSLSETEVVGGSLLRLIDPEFHGVARQCLEDALETGRPGAFRARATNSYGTVTWVENHVGPIRRGEEIVALSITGQDVTEEVGLSEVLSETQYRLRATQFAMDEVGIGVHWVEAATGRFLWVNRFAADLLDYEPEEMLGLSVPDIDPNFPADRFLERTEPIRRRGAVSFESVQRCQDGRTVQVEVTCVYRPMNDEGDDYFISFIKDITERKRAQAVLQQARAEAELAREAKSEFLANVSHELRTPMNAILGLTRMLLEAGLPYEHREKLERVHASSEQMLELVNCVLDVTDLESGPVRQWKTDFRLEDVVSAVIELVRPKAGAVALSVREEPALLARVHADRALLMQALLNYARNAIQVAGVGSVELSASTVQEGEDELVVRFAVKDDGSGVAPEAMIRLFEPFAQVDRATHREHRGVGLGLYMTRRLAEAMGGEAGVDSSVGVGSTFWFTAKLTRAVEAAAPSEPPSAVEAPSRPGTGAARRLLLCEDNPINAEVALNLLEGAGLSVRVVQDGKEAVQAARESTFDLIVMDLHMPGLDGFEAARAIRALPGFESVPIVAMTASKLGEDRGRLEEAGIIDCIFKPLDPADVRRRLGRLLKVDLHDSSKWELGSDQRDLERRLAQVPGIDFEFALRAALGRVDQLLSLLRKFVDHHKHDPERVRDSLSHGDFAAAAHLSHSLKGASSALGAFSLSSCASELDSALRGGGGVNEDLEGFLARLESEFEALETALGSMPTGGRRVAGKVDLSEIRGLFERLDRLLAQYDFDAWTVVNDSGPMLRAAFGERADELERQVDAFKFEEARRTIAKLLEAM